MSRGYGGFAELILEDDMTVIYSYGNLNLNEPGHENRENISDGLITISKEAFVEPEKVEKRKRFPSGRKRIVIKKRLIDVDRIRLLQSLQALRMLW